MNGNVLDDARILELEHWDNDGDHVPDQFDPLGLDAEYVPTLESIRIVGRSNRYDVWSQYDWASPGKNHQNRENADD